MDYYPYTYKHLQMNQHFFEETHFLMSFATTKILALKCSHFFLYNIWFSSVNWTREVDLHKGKKIR